ncbi:Cation channel sperm-associated protein 1 [Lobulomyces angularis]|nr:Cation channel sperm-associated protein 1 [Lobulomyces angularis]
MLDADRSEPSLSSGDSSNYLSANSIYDVSENIENEELDIALYDSKLQYSLLRSPYRNEIFNFIMSSYYNNTLIVIIILHTIILALSTVDKIYRSYGWYFQVFESVVLGIYLLDCFLKFWGWGRSFFKSNWNNFDLFILILNIITLVLPQFMKSDDNDKNLLSSIKLVSNLRSIRSLRILKTVSYLKSLQIIVGTLLKSTRAMISVLSLIDVFSVIATWCFRVNDEKRFGSLGKSFFTIFAMLSIDNWSLIYYDNREKIPYIWPFLVTIMVINTFVLLSFFVAVVVNNLKSSRQKINAVRLKAKAKKKAEMLKAEREFIEESEMELPKNVANSNESLLDEEIEFQKLFQSGFGLDKFYSPNLPQRQKEVMSGYFMLLAALESNTSLYENQHKILDDLVDLTLSQSTEFV